MQSVMFCNKTDYFKEICGAENGMARLAFPASFGWISLSIVNVLRLASLNSFKADAPSS